MDHVEKFRLALTAIAENQAGSFQDIIESEREAFRGLHVTYATNATELTIHGIGLHQVREHCSLITSPFGKKGVLFYSDEVYAANQAGCKVPLTVDYSVALDKNICENVRLLSSGGTLRDPDNFRALLQLIRGRGDESLNFDYLAYIAEEQPHFHVPGNRRPSDTVRALKRLDYLVPGCLYQHPFVPSFDVDDSTLDRVVAAAIENVVDGEMVKEAQLEHRVSYAILLQAALLNWNRGIGQEEKLARLVQSSMETVGKFCKTEVYLAWKLFGGAGRVPAFFDPLSQPSAKILKRVAGMAWDINMLRISEKLAAVRRKAGERKADFFIPLIASLDERFSRLAQACPIRAVVIDFEHGHMTTLFDDELTFQGDVRASMASAKTSFGSHADRQARANAPLDEAKINAAILKLETDIRSGAAGA